MRHNRRVERNHTATSLRDRVYENYVSTHAGRANERATSLFVRRVIVPLLPRPSSQHRVRVAELGAGAGHVVRSLRNLGFDAVGVDASSEQVTLARRSGLETVVLGDAMEFLQGMDSRPDAILAIDFLEHLSKAEVVDLLVSARERLKSGGVMIARLPNAASPFFGRLQYGDLSHDTAFSERSIKQALNLAGFESVSVSAVNPIVHGVVSALRFVVWSSFAFALRVVLIAETGVLRGHIVTQNMMVIARAQ